MRKLIRSRLLLVASLVAGSIGLTATPALAHHPDVSHTLDCVADRWVITWTVRNSESETGSNRTMTIDTLKVSSSKKSVVPTIDGVSEGMTFPPRPLEGSTRTATTVVPGNFNGTITLYVKADWDKKGPQDQSREYPVKIEGKCNTPPEPSATIELSCADGGVKIVLTNSGGGQINFNVKKGDPHEDHVKVGAGESVTKIYPLAEGETVTFTVKGSSGMKDVSETVTRDCQQPAAAISSS